MVFLRHYRRDNCSRSRHLGICCKSTFLHYQLIYEKYIETPISDILYNICPISLTKLWFILILVNNTTTAIFAVFAVMGLVGVAGVTILWIIEDAEARGCKTSQAFNASQGRCFGH